MSFVSFVVRAFEFVNHKGHEGTKDSLIRNRTQRCRRDVARVFRHDAGPITRFGLLPGRQPFPNFFVGKFYSQFTPPHVEDNDISIVEPRQ